MIRASIGISILKSSLKAGEEAARDARDRLKGATPTAGVVFLSIAYDPDEFLKGVVSIIPDVPFVGSSTAGELSSEGLSTDASGLVVLFSTDQCAIDSIATHHIRVNPNGAGREFAEKAVDVARAYHHALLFADPLGGGLDRFMGSVQEHAGSSIGFAGVGSGDDLLYRETYQFRDGAAHTQSATGLLFSGTCTIRTATSNAFVPIGKPEEVTLSRDNVIETIEEKPALELYKSYFGPRHVDLLQMEFNETTASYPLGIRLPDGGHDVRIPKKVTKTQGLELMKPVETGSNIRLMVGDVDETIEGAKRAVRELVKQFGTKKIRALLIFSSVARKRLLGSRNVDDIIRAIQEIVGRDVPIAGMYGYGEIAGAPAAMTQGGVLFWGLAE